MQFVPITQHGQYDAPNASLLKRGKLFDAISLSLFGGYLDCLSLDVYKHNRALSVRSTRAPPTSGAKAELHFFSSKPPLRKASAVGSLYEAWRATGVYFTGELLARHRGTV